MSSSPRRLTAPFPYFGGKRHAAAHVWAAIGDVASYVEPFCGSAAVLLARPSAGRIETVNDASGFVANFWRAVKHDPDAVAEAADWPVIEADLHARHAELVRRRRELLDLVSSDPRAYDAELAGWWCWGASCWIGSGWCAGEYTSRQIPSLSGSDPGVRKRRPALTNQGGTGVHQKRPKTGLPVGINGGSPRLRLGERRLGVHRRQEVYDWMHALSERLRHVRVCCGDWSRVVTRSAMSVGLVESDRPNGGAVGIFLDPPYHASTGRAKALYETDDLECSAQVATWAREAVEEHPLWRIVLAGYEGEHEMPGWREIEWFRGGFGAGGYGTAKGHRERLWMSPACLEPDRQGELFGECG